MSKAKTVPVTAPDPVKSAVAVFGPAEADAADRLTYFRDILNGATKEAEKAKKELLTALGDRFLAMLPDGRFVNRKLTEHAAEAEPRKAYTSTSVVISGVATPAPA